jgi:MFS superfamily sulfate permease-like transporter
VADLGVLVPLATALIVVNGLDAGAVFVCAGALVLASGLWFRIPFPVQPLKALTAIAVAQALSPATIHAGGIELGLVLLVLAVAGIGTRLARLFSRPVIRALQLGVGALLVVGAWRLLIDPPDVFAAVPSRSWLLVLATASFVGVWFAARAAKPWVALAVLLVGVAATVVAASPDLSGPSFAIPRLEVPPAQAFADAFLLLVVPQVPLTFGNAIVAVDDLSHEYFGRAADRVTVPRILVSGGLANVASGLLGGMPMCHGSGGLTAHVKLGARTAGMNLLLGSAFLGLGLLLADQVPTIMGLLPVWVLAGFLAYAGIRHALLVADQRGADLVIALVAGALGAWLANLAVTAALAIVATLAVRRWRRERRTPGTLGG